MFTANVVLGWMSLPPHLERLRVTVLGMARSGRAVAELLRKAGCQVFISDAASTPAVKNTARELRKLGVDVEMGGHSPRTLECDLMVRSPGVPNHNPILLKAHQHGLLIVSEIEVASWFCPAPIIAVTGSNGKTTTVEWLGDLFRRTKPNVAVCGNVGRPFSAFVSKLDVGGIAIVEVSSFQLEDVVRFRPRVAVITNFSPDHLDRHEFYADYLRAKCRIFERQSAQEVLVFNRGDWELARRALKAESKLFSFGLDQPRDCGVGVKGDYIVVSEARGDQTILKCGDVGLPGRHNLENALAVASAAWNMGVPRDVIARSLAEFRGVPHRLESVIESDGILWVNDSKATNVASGLVALDAFARPIFLLAGGRDKGGDFESVAGRVASKVKRVIVFGEAGPKIENAWASAIPVDRASTLADAVKRARQLARRGDVILLSPMCASFDEFNNYEERGDAFKKMVMGK